MSPDAIIVAVRLGTLWHRLRRWTISDPSQDPALDLKWKAPFDLLRRKWSEVPGSFDRVRTPELFRLPDKELLETWDKLFEEAVAGPNFYARGWYHELYRPLIKDSYLIDMGSGLGFDSLAFASIARRVTCVDLVQDNLELLSRLARLKGLKNISFVYLESIASFSGLEPGADVILASGSMHHAPLEVVHREVMELLRVWRVGGRWLQLAYPKARWERDGCYPFSRWGEVTDGRGTPWAEWYDLQKLLRLFETAQVEPILTFDYHNSDFVWFDLIRRG